MAFGHFRYTAYLLGDHVGLRGVGKQQSHVGAGIVAERFGTYFRLEALDYSGSLKFLHSLVDGGAGNIAHTGYFQKRLACVQGKLVKNPAVEAVELRSGHQYCVLITTNLWKNK